MRKRKKQKQITRKKRNQVFMDGSQDKAAKVNHPDGLIVIPVEKIKKPARRNVNLAAGKKVRSAPSIPRVDLLHLLVGQKVKVKSGARNQQMRALIKFINYSSIKI